MPRRKYTNRRERFLEVAEARANSILNKIRVLGHCSNRQLYEYTPEEVYKIFRTIERELEQIKGKFLESERRKNKFRLR